MQDLSLEKLDAVQSAIEQAVTVQEIKGVIDMTSAAATYARQAKKGKEIENKLKEYINRAERKLGEMLQAAKAVGQITTQHHHAKNVVGDNDNVSITLADAGISRDLSSRAQKLARMPSEAFEQMLIDRKNGATRKRQSKRGRETPKLDIAREIVRKKLEANQPISPHSLQKEHGISHVTFDMAITAELARKDAIKNPPIDPATLSLPARERAERYIEQRKRELEIENAANLSAMLKTHFAEYIVHLEKREAAANKILQCRQKLGFMTLDTFKLIRNCLHSDRVTDTKLKADYDRAFVAFCELEKYVLNEKESPTTKLPKPPPLPSDLDELMEAREKATALRKLKREQRKAGKNITSAR